MKTAAGAGAGVARVQIATPSYGKLNASQQAVVQAMVGADEPLVVAHGMYLVVQLISQLTSGVVRRPAWDGKDDNNCRSAGALGATPGAGVGHRALQRRREEHRGKPRQT